MDKRIGYSSAFLLAALCADACAPALAAAPRYTISDLGVLPSGGWSTGYGLNAAGVVVGSGSSSNDGYYHAILWKAGHLRDLDPPTNSGSQASAVNNANFVAGTSLGDAFGTERAMVWAGRNRIDLGSLPGTPASEAEDINDANQVVGSVLYTYDHTQAFLWQHGTMMGLGTLGGRSSAAYGINASGQIVGGADTTGRKQHAFLWHDGAMTDLGTPPGWTMAIAMAISDNGRIVGTGTTAGGATRAFSYVNGTWTVIGAIGADTISEAEDVNSAGYVVGFSRTSYEGADKPDAEAESAPQADSEHAWLYANGTLYDLGTLIPVNSGWGLVRADAINEAGQIAGTGWSPSGGQHGYLLTPIP